MVGDDVQRSTKLLAELPACHGDVKTAATVTVVSCSAELRCGFGVLPGTTIARITARRCRFCRLCYACAVKENTIKTSRATIRAHRTTRREPDPKRCALCAGIYGTYIFTCRVKRFEPKAQFIYKVHADRKCGEQRELRWLLRNSQHEHKACA